MTLDGTGTMPVSQWTTLTGGVLSIIGGDYAPTSGTGNSSNAFTNLADIDGSSIYVYGGGSLTLPAVTSYANDTGDYSYLQADEYTTTTTATGPTTATDRWGCSACRP